MTWLTALIPAPYRLAIMSFLALFAIWVGWHSHTIYDGYIEGKQAKKEVIDARAGEINIIKSNTEYSKEIANVKDKSCINSHVPDNLGKLLDQ